MSWLGDNTFRGLEFVRVRFGEQIYRFVLRLGRVRTRKKAANTRLVEIGKLAGLNAAETVAAAAASKAAITFPLWLKFILSGVAVVAGTLVINYYVETHNVYLPGTLYASISPNDFLTYSKESTLIM